MPLVDRVGNFRLGGIKERSDSCYTQQGCLTHTCPFKRLVSLGAPATCQLHPKVLPAGNLLIVCTFLLASNKKSTLLRQSTVRHDRMPVTSSNLSARIHASLCQSYHVDHLYAILRTWGTWTRSRKDAKMQADDPALIEAMRRLWVLACPCFRLRSQLLAVRHAWIHDGHEQKVETQGKCQPAMVQFGIYCCLSLSCNYPTKHGCSRVA